MIRGDHASRLALRWLSDDAPAPWKQLEGTAVLADLTGFTRLTEALSGLGPEGVEVLHQALTLCFSTLLGPSVASGGDIIGFAGDAALVWFSGSNHEQRGVEAAAAMPANLAHLPAATTGGRRLRVSVGVHTGMVTAMLAGTSQRAMLFCGPEISTLVALESAATSGQVLVSSALAERLPSSYLGAVAPVGRALKLRRRTEPERSSPRRGWTDSHAIDSGSIDSAFDSGSINSDAIDSALVSALHDDSYLTDRLLSVLSPTVRDVIIADAPTGDHRAASIGFVAVPNIDVMLAAHGPDVTHAALHQVITTVVRVAEELSVTWLDADVGLGGVKLLLAAGAPQAVDDDEGRLLIALRRIIDESDVVLRAGAQRGRVFAGSLGVPGRRTFTVVGDPVNVAARALGLAGDRELVTGDGLGVATRPFISAVSLGSTTLKNRVRPVEMWRVSAVQPAVGRDLTRHSAARGVGREYERDRIANAWKVAVEGFGRALTVVGEPGMGASDLLSEAVDRAGAAATLVVADPYRQQVPYITIAAVVRALATAAGAEGDDHGWTWLAGFAPQLGDDARHWIDDGRRAVQRRPRADEIDPISAANRSRVVLAALIEMAAPRPWLLAIDELDAVDDASRLVLRELRDRCMSNGWLLLASIGPDDQSSLDDVTQADTLVLEPFDHDEATQFVIDVEPRLRDDQVAQIVAAGQGNPFVLAELARHPQGGELPDSLERLSISRIDALSVTTRQLVRDASTFGMTMSMTMIAEILNRPELSDPTSWSEASSVLQPTDLGTVSFRHGAYRVAAHQSLPFRRRRELHGAIADHLATVADTSEAVLANHYREAGRTREAFPLTVTAARAAQSSGALVEASELFERAAAMAREVDRAAVGELLVEQGDALMRVGDLDGAERAFVSAGRVIKDPHGYAVMCNHRVDLEIRRSRYKQARRWAQKGLALVAPLGPRSTGLLGKLLLDNAAALYYLGRWHDCLRLATQALEVSTQIGDRLLEGLAHLHLEMAQSALTNPVALDHGNAAVAIFEAIGHERYLGVALCNNGLTASNMGRWDEALSMYRRAVAVVTQTGDAINTAITEMNLGFLLFRQGRLEDADARALRTLRTFETGGLDMFVAYSRHLRSRIAAAEGRFDDAVQLMASARATFVQMDDTAMVLDCDVASLDRLLRAGLANDAVSLAGAIESDMHKADEAVAVAHQLYFGIAETRTSHAAQGAARIVGALRDARRLRLLHEEYLCLSALIDIANSGGPSAPPDAIVRCDDLGRTLGLTIA